MARERGVLIFAGGVEEDPQRELALVHEFARRQADGLVMVPTGDNQAYLMRELAPGTPVVFVDRPPVGLRRLDGEVWEPAAHVVATRLIPRGSGEIPGPYRTSARTSSMA
ncbi:type 1 periplasmic-binding domain-containing protein [Dactylosporangium darangshiense]|uniref:Uncharacterized protein n=1 Tax=Dactylosporangium darangshiense TaxID=579108 RepID=A0ABP8DQU5_9ACTN